jgi:hypothetical protein
MDMKLVYFERYGEREICDIISDDNIEKFLQKVVDKIKSQYDKTYFRKATDYEKGVDIDESNKNLNLYIVKGEYNNPEYKEDEYQCFFEFKDVVLNKFEEKIDKEVYL